MQSFFKELLEYHHHFNQKLGDIFLEQPEKTSEKSIKLFNHILNAHQIWNHRIEQKPPGVTVWEIRPTGDLKAIDKTNYEHSLFILDNYPFDEVIAYKTSAGQPYSNNVRDILFHAMNHCTYHRAQIATDFVQSGIPPLTSDYIFYKR